MKLPNPDRTYIDLKKLEDYCLSSNHLRGKHKAKVFKSALGLTQENAEELKAKLMSIIKTQDCNIGHKDQYGQRYIVDFSFDRNGLNAKVRSTWIVKSGEDFPRLISCYVI